MMGSTPSLVSSPGAEEKAEVVFTPEQKLGLEELERLQYYAGPPSIHDVVKAGLTDWLKFYSDRLEVARAILRLTRDTEDTQVYTGEVVFNKGKIKAISLLLGTVEVERLSGRHLATYGWQHLGFDVFKPPVPNEMKKFKLKFEHQ